MRMLLLVTVLIAMGCAALDEPELAEQAAAVENCGTDGPVGAWLDYIGTQSCASDDANDCLLPTSYIATRSDGRKVRVYGVFRWKAANDTWTAIDESEPRPHILPHFMVGYLKKLRNAYEACPSDYFYGKVYDQVDYLVSDAVERNGALVWEDQYGIAHGMEQADMMMMLSGLARLHYTSGRTKAARGTLGYALRAARPLFLPIGVKTGGVRSVDQANCAAKLARLRPCFWFHSRGRAITGPGPLTRQTVLNQHLHVVRDAIDLSARLRSAAAYMPSDVPVPPSSPGWREFVDWADAMEDRGIGGLYQLAFSQGPTTTSPDRPPNVTQFMRRHETNPPFYSADYGYQMDTGQSYPIAKANTCGYHSHSLNLLAVMYWQFWRHHEAGNLSYEHGWRIEEALSRMFQHDGSDIGDHESRAAIYQFFWTSWPAYYEGLWGCPADDARRLTRFSCEVYAPFYGVPSSWCATFP
jgi:hypothetical protein